MKEIRYSHYDDRGLYNRVTKIITKAKQNLILSFNKETYLWNIKTKRFIK